jgi:ATP synthase protein I
VAFFCRLAAVRNRLDAESTKSGLRGVVPSADNHVPLTLLAQAGVSVGLGLALWVWQGGVVAGSALLGGLTAVVPNAFLAARVMSPRVRGAKDLLRSAWVGEIGKLALTVVLFGLVFALVRPLSAPAVFAGFIAAQLVVFGALLYDTSPASPAKTKN